MKTSNTLKLFVIIIVYGFINVATSKTVNLTNEEQCYYQLTYDTLHHKPQLGFVIRIAERGIGLTTPYIPDTSIFRIFDTTKKQDFVNYFCAKNKQTCNFSNLTILIYDTSYSLNFDSSLMIRGKRILTYKCP